MRPVEVKQSAARYPLNGLLGTEGTVRVLRVLVAAPVPLSAAAIAERADLDVNGTRRTLTRLRAAGIVSAMGQTALTYQLNRHHRLAASLTALFDEERVQYERLLQSTRRFVGHLKPPPTALWLFGSVARRQDRIGSDIDLALVGPGASVRRQARALQHALTTLSHDVSLIPSVTPLTLAELRRYAREDRPLWHHLVQDAVVLYGQSPREAARQ